MAFGLIPSPWESTKHSEHALMSSEFIMMLSEEAVARATRRLQSLLTLVQLRFEAGAGVARRRIACGVLVDPIATCCFGEARELLLRPVPNLPLALVALQFAACREPSCYGPTHTAISSLLFRAVDEAVDAELAATLDEADEAAVEQQE
jgi:hypothetical protein